MNLAADKEEAKPADSAGALEPTPASDAASARSEAPGSPWSTTLAAPQLAILIGSLIGAAMLLVGLLLTEMLVPAHVANELASESQSLRRQNDALRRAGELSAVKIKDYERKLDEVPTAELQSQIAQMQATIDGLEQQIDAIKATEWPPLAAATQDALYEVLKGLPAREVWVGYADSGGRALAKNFSEVFKRLNWPQKYDILAVADPQQGLWITPISDFSDDVRGRVQQATGLKFQLFPHREQLPDARQIGIIIGYRTARDADVP